MKIFPAIDLYDGKAVRLYKGDYAAMTVYNDDPLIVVKDFERCGAEYIHIVDLEGAKSGLTPNFNAIQKIAASTSLFIEVGGGIRSLEACERMLSCGVDRVIIGTAAVTDEEFLIKAIDKYGDKIAVGADVKDGFVALKGWVEKSGVDLSSFLQRMCQLNVQTVICTDISKDGAMIGTNREMYAQLIEQFSGKLNIIASGGVSTLDDVISLKRIGVEGAIIGKAYYIGAIDLKKAVEVSR